MYNCASDGLIVNKGASVPGLKVENNEFYLTETYYTRDGSFGCGENGIDLKGAGTESNPVLIFHNRFWGFRNTDNTCSGTGSAGEAIIIHEDEVPTSDWVLVKNNVIVDSPQGVSCPNGGSDHISIIGNLFYDINSSGTGRVGYAINLRKIDDTEVYLNTIIDPEQHWANFGGDNQDVRCNLIINGKTAAGSPGSGTVVDNNVFYNTEEFSNLGASENIVHGEVSHSKHVSYCFFRKVFTGPERFCIPNAWPTFESPHVSACDINLGARTNIGIDDKRY